jgi:hypothetical protein
MRDEFDSDVQREKLCHQSQALRSAFRGVCVYYCRTYYKAVRGGGGGEWRTCAMRDDEPRPVWKGSFSERVLFGTQFSILYTSVYPPAGAA